MESLRQLIWLGESAGVPLCTVYQRAMFAVYVKKYRILARVAVIFYTKNAGYTPRSLYSHVDGESGRKNQFVNIIELWQCDTIFLYGWVGLVAVSNIKIHFFIDKTAPK